MKRTRSFRETDVVVLRTQINAQIIGRRSYQIKKMIACIGLIIQFICPTCFILSAQNIPPKINGVVYNPDSIMPMVYVEGSGNINGFYIGIYEVTQKQWEAVMGNNPSYLKGDYLPVEQVSWSEAQEFIARINEKTGRNYRLPTGAEWEYAAKGGTNNDKYKYAGSNNIDEVAWYDRNSDKRTHVVGSKKPNSLGIYDMSGNVAEFCEDGLRNTACFGYAAHCSVTKHLDFGGKGWFEFTKDSKSWGMGFRIILPEQ